MLFDFVDDEGNTDIWAKTLWIQELTRRGVLVLTTLNISSALTEDDVYKSLDAFASAFKIVSNAKFSNSTNMQELVDGSPATPAFKVRS